MKSSLFSRVTLFLLISGTILTAGNNWPQFRGPGGQSIAKGQTLPDDIDPSKPLWKTALPVGHSSPAIWGDRIFLTAHEDLTVWMICIDRNTGEVLWKEDRAIENVPRYVHEAGSPAISTPATNGSLVVFQFGDVGVIALDLDGNLQWEKPILVPNDSFGYGSSPVIVGDRLIINSDGGVQSAIYCLDVNTGREIWVTEREGMMYSSYAAPHIWKRDHRTEVLQAGGSQLWSFDLTTGEALWHVSNLPSLICPTPIAQGDRVFAGGWATMHVSGVAMIESILPPDFIMTDEEKTSASALIKRLDANRDGKLTREELPPSRARDAFNFGDGNQDDFWDVSEISQFYLEREQPPGRNVFVAIEPDGKGDRTDSDVIWELRKNLPYVSSPLLYEDRLYLVKKGGTISCLNPDTGEVYFERKRLGAPGEYFASPIGIDGKILVPSERGVLVTLKASDSFEILSKVDFGEKLIASPAIVDNRLYLRTDQHLYAF